MKSPGAASSEAFPPTVKPGLTGYLTRAAMTKCHRQRGLTPEIYFLIVLEAQVQGPGVAGLVASEIFSLAGCRPLAPSHGHAFLVQETVVSLVFL